MSRARTLAATAIAGLLLLPATASAAPTVGISEFTVNGSSVTVTGSAVFQAITEAQSVGGANVNWGPAQAAPVAEAAGINMTDAKIVPLANGSGLRFIWSLSNLPEQVPPEVVRYTWSFLIGETQYQLQAKRTNLLSITTVEDPVNHVLQARDGKMFFQLRGACQTSYQGAPTSGCFHLAFLTGAFDSANKQVFVDLPYNPKDNIGRLVAPDFKPGAVLMENLSAGMSIAAAFQAVVGNTTTSDYTNGWDPYFVGPQVSLGVGPANSAPVNANYTGGATLTGESFSGTIGGISGTMNTVFVRACNGTECSYASERVA